MLKVRSIQDQQCRQVDRRISILRRRNDDEDENIHSDRQAIQAPEIEPAAPCILCDTMQSIARAHLRPATEYYCIIQPINGHRIRTAYPD